MTDETKIDAVIQLSEERKPFRFSLKFILGVLTITSVTLAYCVRNSVFASFVLVAFFLLGFMGVMCGFCWWASSMGDLTRQRILTFLTLVGMTCLMLQTLALRPWSPFLQVFAFLCLLIALLVGMSKRGIS